MFVFHRFVQAPQGRHGLAVSDCENPGRDLADAVVAVGPLPDDQHGVVEHFLYQMRPAYPVDDEAGQTGVVDPVELFEGAQLSAGHTTDQTRLVVRAHLDGRSDLTTRGAWPAQHRHPRTRPLMASGDEKVQRDAPYPQSSPKPDRRR